MLRSVLRIEKCLGSDSLRLFSSRIIGSGDIPFGKKYSKIIGSDEEAKAVRNDVLKIVRGPGLGQGSAADNLYLISALSDLRRILKKSLKTGHKSQITMTSLGINQGSRTWSS